jgi:hypothetical protein
MLTLPCIYTRIILVIGMEENCKNNEISNQEKQPAGDQVTEVRRIVPDETCPESKEDSGNHKKIERCEPCLHCGSHCIYLNRE